MGRAYLRDQPEDVGLERVKPEALRGGEAKHNAQALVDVLEGKTGPFRDVAVLNAAAGLIVAGRAKDLKQAVALAQKAVDQVRPTADCNA